MYRLKNWTRIRFEKEFVLTRAQESLLPSTKEIPLVGKRGKTCEHRKQKSHGAHTNGKSTGKHIKNRTRETEQQKPERSIKENKGGKNRRTHGKAQLKEQEQ